MIFSPRLINYWRILRGKDQEVAWEVRLLLPCCFCSIYKTFLCRMWISLHRPPSPSSENHKVDVSLFDDWRLNYWFGFRIFFKPEILKPRAFETFMGEWRTMETWYYYIPLDRLHWHAICTRQWESGQRLYTNLLEFKHSGYFSGFCYAFNKPCSLS